MDDCRESNRSRIEGDLISPLKKSGCYRLVKDDDMQGVQIPRNESYIAYVAVTRDEAQRSRSRSSTACYRGDVCALRDPTGKDTALDGATHRDTRREMKRSIRTEFHRRYQAIKNDIRIRKRTWI